ncbi:ABC transporter ATP-binding protein [Streptomyces sp. HNM0575]|uniref:ABC transporter ATP-binding protein n=1 Tax=Streptomyces sp. HNM0575 TaxID=2716338 RepID=UPI00145F2FFE|nr:ABC transporter ATP-binding protein [Streptomyces sp. HNM0575]NLU71495.1 ABC transporter ATP-binding protein [Streptomyces sp. HNM0575]
MTDSVLSAEDIGKFFHSGDGGGVGGVVQALDGVSLTVGEGEFVCVVGPSGCGKSTLLRILGGLEGPSSGRVERRDGGSAGGPPGVPQAAFVFQDFGVLPWLTVRSNAAFGLRMAGVRRRDAERAAEEWLLRMDLAAFAGAYPDQLSGGMRQRLGLARAFTTGSPVLLMDEPLGALDPQTRRLMQEQLLALWQEERKTVVLVTHSIDEAILLGDRVLVMSARPGRLTDEFEVPFPRPRDPGIQDGPEFGRLRARVWDELRDQVSVGLGTGAGAGADPGHGAASGYGADSGYGAGSGSGYGADPRAGAGAA